MVGHKTNLNKFKEIKIISSIFSDHNGLKLKTKLKEKTQKHSDVWRLNNMFLNNKWVNNEIKEETKKYLEWNENEHTKTQNLWDTAKAVLRGKFIATQATLKRIEKSQINNLTLRLQELEEKQQQTESRARRKEGNNQDQSRIKWQRD